jgi:tRNA threonylcarbamoyladenosine biosynthesis protein TsaB
MAPDVLAVEIACARLAELRPIGPIDIVGSGAALLEGLVAGARILPRAAPDPLALARLAQSKPLTPARPLYLRAPDAKLPGGLDPAVA